MSWQIDQSRGWLRFDSGRIRLADITFYANTSCDYAHQAEFRHDGRINVLRFGSQEQVDKFISALDQVFRITWDNWAAGCRGFTTAEEQLPPT